MNLSCPGCDCGREGYETLKFIRRCHLTPSTIKPRPGYRLELRITLGEFLMNFKFAKYERLVMIY